MFNRLFSFGCACLLAFEVSAQTTVGEMWQNMPDSLAPAYLKADKRRAMVDYYNMGETAEVIHSLQGVSTLDMLSASYAEVTLSGALSMQLALLPTAQGDTILCRVVTVTAPAKESKVEFFDTKWNKLKTDEYLTNVTFEQLVQRPDTLNEDEFSYLCTFFEPRLIYSVFNPDDSSLAFALDTPLTSRFDKERLEAIMMQRKLKWDGKMYK